MTTIKIPSPPSSSECNSQSRKRVVQGTQHSILLEEKGINNKKNSDDEEKYFFLSDPSISDESPASPYRYTSPVLKGGLETGQGAGEPQSVSSSTGVVNGRIEETKTTVEFRIPGCRLKDGDDLSGRPQEDLTISTPPNVTSQASPNSSSKRKTFGRKEECTTPESGRYLTAEEGRESVGSSDLSYDTSIEPDSSKQAEIEEKMDYKAKRKKYVTSLDSFSTALLDDETELSTSVDHKIDTESNNIGEKSPESVILENNVQKFILKSPGLSDKKEGMGGDKLVFGESNQIKKANKASDSFPLSSDAHKSHLNTIQSRKKEEEDHVARAADTEQNNYRPRRKRSYENGKRPTYHRRTRSGDEAAATLMAGGREWIGMELDQLPLPNEREDEDEDDDTEKCNGKGENKKDSGSILQGRSNLWRENERPFGVSRQSVRFSGETSNDRNSARRNSFDAAYEEKNLKRKPRESFLKKMKEEGGPAFSTFRDGHSKWSEHESESEEGNKVSPIETHSPWLESSSDNVAAKYLNSQRNNRFVGENTAESEFLIPSKELLSSSTSGWPSQRQSKLMPYEYRRESVGDASVSTIESHESHSVFSWISNKVSVFSGKTEKRDNTESSLNLSDESEIESIMENLDPTSLRRNSLKDNMALSSASQFRQRGSNGMSLTSEYLPIPPPPPTESDQVPKYPEYTCPRCNTKQRMFFTVNSAPKQFLESPTAYLGVYFALYLILSLTIFGMEEGWPLLECIYFSVMTVTACGLGDYVPTSNSAKIICSILIYFGIACIGLVFGSLHANSLDSASKMAERDSMLKNCPKCAGLERKKNRSVEDLEAGKFSSSSKNKFTEDGKTLQTINETNSSTRIAESDISLLPVFPSASDNVSSELTAPVDVMCRQSHTRHYSFDTIERGNASPFDSSMFPKTKGGIHESNYLLEAKTLRSRNKSEVTGQRSPGLDDNSDESDCSYTSTFMSNAIGRDNFRPVSSVNAAKYVFLTMRQAVANTTLIIVVGMVGFHYIERLSLVDAFYFTMVLLTTVGYGDIVPKTSGGKIFASVYCVVAGILVLQNMSMISTIPLELRKRRLESAVLMQFGDELDDVALRELANGPLVKRLQISENRQDGLNKCTREMFALAMLVRLGRVTEQDVRLTYAAFRQLDKDNDGMLTSKEIIMSMSAAKRKKKGYKSPDKRLGQYQAPYDYLSNHDHPLIGQHNKSTHDQIFDDELRRNQRLKEMSVENQFSVITSNGIDGGDYGSCKWDEDNITKD